MRQVKILLASLCFVMTSYAWPKETKVIAMTQAPAVLQGNMEDFSLPRILEAPADYCTAEIPSCFVILFNAVLESPPQAPVQVSNILTGLFESRDEAQDWIESIKNYFKYRGKRYKLKPNASAYISFTEKIRLYYTTTQDWSGPLKNSDFRSVHLLYRAIGGQAQEWGPGFEKGPLPLLDGSFFPSPLPKSVTTFINGHGNDIRILVNPKKEKP